MPRRCAYGARRSALRRFGQCDTVRDALGRWRGCMAAAIAILLALPVAASDTPPVPTLKPPQIIVEPAPAWSVTAEHAVCFLFPAEADVRRCLMTIDLMVEIGAE